MGSGVGASDAAITPPDTLDEPSEDRANIRWRHDYFKELQDAVRAIQPRRTGSPAVGNKPLMNSIAIQIPRGAAWDDSESSDSDDEYGPPPMHIRKQSGELVKSALRPAQSRRRYSMPGTPTYSKSVHYNDDTNRVRHFMQVDRPIAISAGTSPVEQYESETEFPFASPPRKTSDDVSPQATVAGPRTRYDFSPALRAAVDAAEKILGAEKLDTPAVILKKRTPSPCRDSASPAVEVSLDTAQPALDSKEYRDLIEKYCFFGSAKRKPDDVGYT
nr:hypothetical protein B0A51_03789 [Rachicladosporium sp. CCFEE 5018]